MRRLLVSFLLLLTLPLFATEKPVPPADLANPPADAERSEDGLVMKVLVKGTGTKTLGADDFARVRYTVWKSDGTLVQHVGAPQFLMIPVTKMIPGWARAATQMVEGETRRVWIPAALANAKLDEGQLLVIDTELVEIVPRPTAPADLAAPPADATRTPSGLAYKVLRPGTGTTHPKRHDTVIVHYSGWTAEGKLIDSSILRGTPGEFPLDEVIKGWTEGMQLMTAGERTRFWIPAKLAYASDRSKPQGMLVFDIELISFH